MVTPEILSLLSVSIIGIARLQSGDFLQLMPILTKRLFIRRLLLGISKQIASIEIFCPGTLADIANYPGHPTRVPYTDDGELHAIEHMIKRKVWIMPLLYYCRHVCRINMLMIQIVFGARGSLLSHLNGLQRTLCKRVPFAGLFARNLNHLRHLPIIGLSLLRMCGLRWENYRGYTFYVVSGYYFAILDQSGDFDLAKFKRGVRIQPCG